MVTWTLGSSVAPDIAIIHRNVLKMETDGSLTFRNVSFLYSNTYTVEIVKSGLKTVSATFVLKVYGEYWAFGASFPDPEKSYSFTKKQFQ